MWCLQDQGAAEINISLLGQHINKELGILSDVGVKTDRSLDDIATAMKNIEEEARKNGTLQMVAAAIEILQKYRRITHRFELIKRRSTPSIICKPAPKIDFEGDGGSSPEVTILYAGHMPYCGPTFGLSHMHVITEHVHKGEEDEDDNKSEHSAKSTPRQKGQGLKKGPLVQI